MPYYLKSFYNGFFTFKDVYESRYYILDGYGSTKFTFGCRFMSSNVDNWFNKYIIKYKPPPTTNFWNDGYGF